MSTSALLSLGMRAMAANQAALQTIGQNISNANTPGYSRQSVVLTTPAGQYTGAGFFGKGVQVETVTRSYNSFLTRDAADAKSAASMDSARYEQLQQLEKLFQPGEQGLGQAANQFLNSLVDVSVSPADPSARQVVLGRAEELAARFASVGQQLADLQAGVVSDLRTSVDVVNQLSQQIAAANDQIARVTGSGHTPNDLLDKRDQLISELSQYVQVSTLPASDGTMGVFIGGGQRLVLGSIAQELSITADPYDTSRGQLSIVDSAGARKLDESVLTGGSISALLKYQNTDLQDARNLLGQMAMAISERVNEQQSLGLDLSHPPGQGAAIFSYNPPRALPATTNARNPDGTFASGIELEITDATRVPASSFTLSRDPNNAANYLITTLPDGSPESMDAATFESRYGVKITETGTSVAIGDSFRLEPVASASVGMKRTLDSTNGIAAASPVTAVSGLKNTGTMTVDSLYAVNSNIATTVDTSAPRVPLQIVFGTVNTDNSINYTVTLNDGTVINDSWTAGETIGNFPLSGVDLGFELRLNGVPRENDTIDISATAFSTSNNGNAKAFLNMQKETFVGRTLLADGTLTRGATITDAYASAMSNIGSRVQGAEYLSGVSTTMAAEAEKVRSGSAGVNVDEETARLMQFQQSYQAAAKVLQVGQTIFDELLKLSQR